MKATTTQGVKVYNLTAGKTLPGWLNEKRRAALRRDDEFRRRIELIQGFEMPTASSRVRMTPDGQHVLLAGTYPPCVRMYELSQLGQKFERRLDGEVTQLQCLGDDWKKFAVLRGTDRTVELHAQAGSYHKVRIPRAGRDMLYHAQSCDLCVCGSASHIYRINLEQGRFLEPLTVRSAALDSCDVSPAHSLLAFGGTTGLVECFDPRTREEIAVLDVASHASQSMGISAVTFCGDGLTMGVGTSTGQCLLYDLRAPRPFASKPHRNGTPIVAMRFHESAIDGHTRVASCDNRVVRVWDKAGADNDLLFAIEPSAGGDITDLCTVGTSGMIFLTGEFARVQILYVPALGPAPKWCSFLDNLTEEMEEAAPNVYADFKFVTKQELAQLGLDRLIGTPYLRAYMHGFFVDMRAYKRVREVVDPFAYDRYRAELVRAKLDAKTSTRIFARTKLPKVNPRAATSSAAKDERFAAMFNNEDFTITAEEAADVPSSRVRFASTSIPKAERESEDDTGEDEDDTQIAEADDLEAALSGKHDKRETARAAAKAAKVQAAQPLEARAKDEMERERAQQAAARRHGPRVLGSGSGIAPGQHEMSFIPEKEKRQAREKKEKAVAARTGREGRQQRLRRLAASGRSRRGGRGGKH